MSTKEKIKDKKHSQKALYRKYRPGSFAEVLGQDHIVTALQGALSQNTISHAYLFAGTRGTGKTSVARIFAESIGAHGNDVYEIDAASNRGIDDVREIRESVQTLPFESTYKVYIIDEAHMLTKEAWNAFLKTLEEPPEYVVFILATTELEKVPETVLSRCQVFQFKKPSIGILKDVVNGIAKKEGYSLDPAGAELIALLGDGSFRDTQGVLDKVLSFSQDKKITLDTIATLTGAPHNSLVQDFVHAIASTSIPDALAVIQKAVEQNVSISVWLKMVIQNIRFVLLLKFGGASSLAMVTASCNPEDLLFLTALAKQQASGITSQALTRLLTAYEGVERNFSPGLSVELAVIDILESKQK